MSAFYFSFTCFYNLYCFFGRLIFYESMLAVGENWRFQMRKWCIMHLYVHSVDESEPWMKVLQTFQKPRPIFFFPAWQQSSKIQLPVGSPGFFLQRACEQGWVLICPWVQTLINCCTSQDLPLNVTRNWLWPCATLQRSAGLVGWAVRGRRPKVETEMWF